MNRLTKISAALLAAASCASCAVGPDFRSPGTPSPAQYGAQPGAGSTVSAPVPGGEAQTFTAGKAVPEQWWALFGSSKLNQLVEQAFAGSPSLTAAQAALRQADENFRAIKGNLWPSVDGHFAATRQKIDSASFGSPAGGTAIYNLYNAGVDVSYALDLFGGVRRGLEAQAALHEQQQYEYEAAYQTLAANVVTGAVQEARLRQLIAGKVSVISDLEKLLDITQKRYELGAISQADLLSARSALASERAVLPALEQQLAQTQNQLAVYLGKLPSERVSTDFDLAELTLPQDIPVTLPSELVHQRPDVRAAEAQLHRASAEIGIASAARLPQLSLSANYGTQASSTSKLFTTDIWSIGANLSAPLFRAGELSARHRAAIAAGDQAAAQYRQTVLQAFQNVADSLRALEADAQVVQAQYEAAKAAEEGLQLIRKQYELGMVSYMDVLDVQQQTTLAKTGLVQALADRYQDTAALFLALGGGWDGERLRSATNPAP